MPLIGVNTFLATGDAVEEVRGAELIRSSEEEKQAQVTGVHDFQERHAGESARALERLQAVAASRGNVFGELMETVKVCSLGQISRALYEVGGQYRRNV